MKIQQGSVGISGNNRRLCLPVSERERRRDIVIWFDQSSALIDRLFIQFVNQLTLWHWNITPHRMTRLTLPTDQTSSSSSSRHHRWSTGGASSRKANCKFGASSRTIAIISCRISAIPVHTSAIQRSAGTVERVSVSKDIRMRTIWNDSIKHVIDSA